MANGEDVPNVVQCTLRDLRKGDRFSYFEPSPYLFPWSKIHYVVVNYVCEPSIIVEQNGTPYRSVLMRSDRKVFRLQELSDGRVREEQGSGSQVLGCV